MSLEHLLLSRYPSQRRAASRFRVQGVGCTASAVISRMVGAPTVLPVHLRTSFHSESSNITNSTTSEHVGMIILREIGFGIGGFGRTADAAIARMVQSIVIN